jgi:hypothetical protein
MYELIGVGQWMNLRNAKYVQINFMYKFKGVGQWMETKVDNG